MVQSWDKQSERKRQRRKKERWVLSPLTFIVYLVYDSYIKLDFPRCFVHICTANSSSGSELGGDGTEHESQVEQAVGSEQCCPPSMVPSPLVTLSCSEAQNVWENTYLDLFLYTNICKKPLWNRIIPILFMGRVSFLDVMITGQQTYLCYHLLA